MKKIFLFILLLLVPLCAWGQQCSDDNQMARLSPAMLWSVPAAAPAGGACPDAAANLICEDFEGSTDCGTGQSTCRETWATPYETDGTFAADTAASSSCTDKGSYEATITTTDASNDVEICKAISDATTVTLTMMVKVTSESMSNTSAIVALVADPDWSPYLSIVILDSAGTLFVGVSDTVNPIQSTSTITPGTWYQVGLKWVSGTSLSVIFNGSTEFTDTTGIVTGTMTQACVGTYNAGPIVFVIDNIKIGNSTQPDSCTE